MNTHRHLDGRTPGFEAPATTLLMAAVASLRGLLPGVVGLLCLIGSVVPANATAPIVPLVTAHHHWDHHWFVWLPRHPVYESVGVMSIDYRAVWGFFTERGLTWRLHSPPWMVEYPFESIIKPNGGGYALVIRSLVQ